MKLVPHVRNLIRSSAKLKNLFLIFKTPDLGSGALRLKLTQRAVSCQTIKYSFVELEANKSTTLPTLKKVGLVVQTVCCLALRLNQDTWTLKSQVQFNDSTLQDTLQNNMIAEVT